MNIYIRKDREEILKTYARTMGRSVSSLIGEFVDDLGKAYEQEKEIQSLLPKREPKIPPEKKFLEKPSDKYCEHGLRQFCKLH